MLACVKTKPRSFPGRKLCLLAHGTSTVFPGSDGVLSTEAHSEFMGLSPASSPETVCSLAPWRMRNYWLLECFSGHWALKVKGLLDGKQQAKFTQPSKASGSPEAHSIRSHRTAGTSSPQLDTCPRRMEVFLPHCTADIKQKSHCRVLFRLETTQTLRNILLSLCFPLLLLSLQLIWEESLTKWYVLLSYSPTGIAPEGGRISTYLYAYSM